MLVLANVERAAGLLEWKAAGEETVGGEAVKEVMVDGSAGRKAEILVPGVTLDDASRAVDHGHAVQACDSMVGRVPSVRAIVFHTFRLLADLHTYAACRCRIGFTVLQNNYYANTNPQGHVHTLL